MIPGAASVAEADRILRGQFRLFSYHEVDVGDFPDWRRNPLTSDAAPADCHWTEVGDFRFGDIKCIWELSRFEWAFCLARAFRRTGDAKYAERFWTLFEHWLLHNPPNQGPNWMCGQEASVRLMAVAFATDVIRAGENDGRRIALARFVAASCRRIRANIAYALSQSNNHGITECVGLITAAALLPDDLESGAWHSFGLEALRKQVSELVYPDGGFAQHSAIYHRLLLHDLLWAIAVLRGTTRTVPAWLAEAARRALHFVVALMDAATGRLPLYGANDGANILPLADADFLDFRPTVQAASALLHGVRPLAPGPWDEMAEWMGGAEAPPLSVDCDSLSGARGTQPSAGGQIPGRKPSKQDLPKGAEHFPEAGCLTWKNGQTRLFFRCPTRFRHRPSQADLLHADISWRGQRIAHDAGTFSYNVMGRFAGALKEAAVHNTVTFDGREPMEKAGRFLYLPWPRGSVVWDTAHQAFSATHDGWRRLGVRHIRTLTAPAESAFEVRDEIKGMGRHRARLQWLLADGLHTLDGRTLTLHTAAGDFRVGWSGAEATLSIVRGDQASNRGWWSPHYFQAEPALSLVLEFEFDGAVSFTTRFAPAAE